MRDRVSGLESHQLEIVKDLDTKFEAIMKELKRNVLPNEDINKLHGFMNYLIRTLQVYNTLFNKYIMNDGVLLMRIRNILNYKIGEQMI